MRDWAALVLIFGVVAGCGPKAVPDSTSEPNGARAALPLPQDSSKSYFREAPPNTIDFVHRPERSVERGDEDSANRYFMPDIMGSGAALFDYDNDGDLDIFLLHGAPSGDESAGAVGNRLFRQDPGGKFVDVKVEAGLSGAGGDSGYGMGVAIADCDNDGDLDIYVTAFGADQLWLNDGKGKFTDATAAAGLENIRWSTAACFFDFDRDGWLDLLVVNYVDYYPGSQCEDASGSRDYCGPTSFAGAGDRLFRNLGGEGTGDGQGVRFAEVTVESGLSAKAGRGLGCYCADFNGDGLPDIFVANDMEANFLWIQQADGTFREQAELLGVAVNAIGQAEANMGVAWGDLNDDSFGDLFVTHLRGETNTLFLGGEGGVFIDGTPASGLGPPSLPFTGFGTAAIDIEHDGDLDLLVVNGRVKRAPVVSAKSPLSPFWNDYAETNFVFLNAGQGKFIDASDQAGRFAGTIDIGRGLAYGDIDNDGDLDLLVSNCAGPARVYYNQLAEEKKASEGRWLSLRTIDPALQRDAIGAEIIVFVGERQYRRLCNPSSSYLAANDLRTHVGMGPARSYDKVSVLWPDGNLEWFPGGETNRFVVLRKGEGE
jgi:hypothetical protein